MQVNESVNGITRRLHLEGVDSSLTCYATLNKDQDGRTIGLNLCANKQGTLEHGLLHCFGLLVSLCLEHGVPPQRVIDALKGVEFEPNGFTGDRDIKSVRSMADYVARWMEAQAA